MDTTHIAIGIAVLFLLFCLITFFCILFGLLYFKKIKSYTQQLYQKDLDFQKAITKTIIETQEQALNNISQDLHDDACQQVGSINFQLEHLKLDSPELAKSLEPVSKSLNQLLQSIRGISHSLNNQVILQKDLIKVIGAEIKRLKKNKKMAISFTFEEFARKAFTDNEKIFIYRIFQECVNNCLKHSKCNKMSIHIRTTPEFEMAFTDNGVGFDPQAGPSKPSLGLASMKTRAADIKYTLMIDSQKGEGTRITLSENKPK